jgi:hypothetical protein
MPTANAQNKRTGETSVVRRHTVAEATRQLSNILRINGWNGDPATIKPGVRIEHGAFRYWVDSEEERR